MTSSIFTRIEKLESRHRNDGHVLLLWINPNDDVDAAVLAANKAGLFASGDLVMCAEWLGDDPMPKPRWTQARGRALFRTGRSLHYGNARKTNCNGGGSYR